MFISEYKSYDEYIEQQEEQNYKNCEEYHKCQNCEKYNTCKYFQKYHDDSYDSDSEYDYQEIQNHKWCMKCRERQKCKNIIFKESKYIDNILKFCDKYVNDKTYVYKLCNHYSIMDNSRRWLVILQKLAGTKTNEHRFGVLDTNCAKFRANKLKVIEIIDIYNPKYTKKSIINTFDSVHKKPYEVGKIIESDAFDEDIDSVCSDGIHYYNTPLPACYYRDVPNNYTGNWITWYNNGHKQSEGGYINGEQSGKWIEMSYDGNMHREYNFT